MLEPGLTFDVALRNLPSLFIDIAPFGSLVC